MSGQMTELSTLRHEWLFIRCLVNLDILIEYRGHLVADETPAADCRSLPAWVKVKKLLYLLTTCTYSYNNILQSSFISMAMPDQVSWTTSLLVTSQIARWQEVQQAKHRCDRGRSSWRWWGGGKRGGHWHWQHLHFRGWTSRWRQDTSLHGRDI